jgi:hypothetical protein
MKLTQSAWTYAIAFVVAIVVLAYVFRERYVNYADALNDVGQTTGYTTTNPTTGQTTTTGVGAAGTVTTGNTTGGSSTTPASNAGGSGSATGSGTSPLAVDSQVVAGIPGNNVFGPAFAGVGYNVDGNGNLGPVPYPYLFGPTPDSSRMVEGAGITGPSSAASLSASGALPSGKSLGSDKNSQFLGTSRVPGDNDIISNPLGGAPGLGPGNPYLANNAFTASSGSAKTEPLPYLTDFSAFGK